MLHRLRTGRFTRRLLPSPRGGTQLNPVEGMELLLDKLKLTKTNKEFLASMHSMG